MLIFKVEFHSSGTIRRYWYVGTTGLHTMTHDRDEGRAYRRFDRRTVLRATAFTGAAAFGVPSLAGVAAAGSVPDRLYWTSCQSVRADGLSRGAELAVLLYGPDGLSEAPVRATTRMESEPPWGFEFAPEWGGQTVVGVRTSAGSYVLNPVPCAAAPYREAVRNAYGADRETLPEIANVVVDEDDGDGADGGDTEGPFERVARLGQDDPGWRTTFGTATAIADGQLLVGFPDNINPNGFRAGAAYVYERRDGEWTEVQKLLADVSGKTRSAHFGRSLDVEGDRLVVGSEEKIDPIGQDVGMLYVFERTDGEWTQTARLDPSEPMRYFTTSVAVAGDWAFFGAAFDEAEQFSHNPVSVFAYDGESWSEADPIVSDEPTPDLLFGLSVDFDGDRGVVAAPRHENWREDLPGRAYVYERDGDEWAQTAKLLEPEEASGEFATTVALDGDDLFVGNPAFSSNAVYRYAYDGTEWVLADTLTPADPSVDRFSRNLAVADGTLLVGSDAGVHVFESGGEWTETQFLDTEIPSTSLSVDSSLAAATGDLNEVSVFER